MKLSFDVGLADAYINQTQRIRVLSEHWVGSQVYCPHCGHIDLKQYRNNKPVADFFCSSCNEGYELKSKKNKIGSKLVDGAYRTMAMRLNESSNPNLFILTYNGHEMSVTNFLIVPKHFFTSQIIEKRKPLAKTARRAGWIGCNILLQSIPDAGQIFLVRNGITLPKGEVIEKWKRTLFLRERSSAGAKGWLLSVMKCVETLNKREFSIDEIYSKEDEFRRLYPNNNHVREKVRQQLQFLRDKGYLEFVSRGKYRVA